MQVSITALFVKPPASGRFRVNRFSAVRMIPLLLLLAVAPLAAQSPTPTSTTGEAAPSSDEQRQMLERMRQYTDRYAANLPNFLCQQITRQFQAGKKPTHWRKGDVLSVRLAFNGGHEQHTLELVNDKPVSKAYFPRVPLTTEGEFGPLLWGALDDGQNVQFTWKGWETVRGKRLAVFEYAVDKAHSRTTVGLGDLSATVPYQGSIYGDPATGAVWRLTKRETDIPPEVQTKSVLTVVEYGEVKIGEQSYLLPVEASVLADTGSNNILNQMSFENYRKFEAESHLTFSVKDPN
jgi:hypothetical protein